MRRYTKPIGWPRHDSRHYRFAVPNEVWEYKLRSAEFVLLFYLCYRQAHDRGGKKICTQAVADSLHLTAATVEKHLATMVGKGFVTENGGPALKCEAGKFFMLPNEIFLLHLPSSAFMVYAYLLLIENRRTHTCHPSYNTIAAETDLSKNTVLKSVGVLLEMGLITVETTRYFDKHGMKWKGNNLYTILPIRIAMEAFHQRQLYQLELDTERNHIQKQQEKAPALFCAGAVTTTRSAGGLRGTGARSRTIGCLPIWRLSD